MNSFKDKLEISKDIHKDMKLLVETCENYEGDENNPWRAFSKSFWVLSRTFPFEVDWTDFDEGYEYDIKARYYAIDRFMEGLA